MTGFFAHLALKEWPFTVVPRPEFCTFIAGRPQLREDIGFLLQSLTRRDTSSIHVFWSWLGAGKTHALYYIANEANRISGESAPVALLPLYTEFPKGASSFLDLYRALLPRLALTTVVEAFLEVYTNNSGSAYYEQIRNACPDMAACMRVLAIENDPQKRSIATRWLRADRLPVAEFRRVGISEKLDTTERATLVLSIIVKLLNQSARLSGLQGRRVIWLLDEFQRLGRSGGRAVADINAGLHSLFNSCPVGLTQVLSFSGPPRERSLPRCFSPELRDRIGTTKVMILPPCQREEAVAFIRDVLAHFRSLSAASPSPFFPFSEEACRHIVDYLSSKTELRARALMHVFNAVLESADPQIQAGKIKVITPDFADSVLYNYIVLSDTEEEE